MNILLSHISVLLLSLTLLFSGSCKNNYPYGKTVVSVKGDHWYVNGRVLNGNTPGEGLLMNVRMVNSVFEDRGNQMPSQYREFDPEKNTNQFISKIPEYTSSGVNGFTISLQGGTPGYEGAVNTAFEADGSLRDEYMERVAKVIRCADENSGVVILSCLYQRQHSHNSALNGKDAIREAITNTVMWIKKHDFRNVALEVSNEYRHGGYLNWKDGKWLVSAKGQIELISLAKKLCPGLLVSTSGMGNGQMNDSLVKAVDYITIHFNDTSLEDYKSKISGLKKSGKPVVCNEDDKTGLAGVRALTLSVLNGCGWGYMNSRQNQYMPFNFDGVKDDSVVYDQFKRITTRGYQIESE